MDIATATQLVTAGTALAAVVIGPLASVKVAKQQIHADVVLKSRRQWINTLRRDVSRYIATLQLAEISRLSDDEEKEVIERLMYLLAKIRLTLNPKEEDHQQLVAEMHTAFQALQPPGSDARAVRIAVGEKPPLHASIERLIGISQSILKREWDRVSKGKHAKGPTAVPVPAKPRPKLQTSTV